MYVTKYSFRVTIYIKTNRCTLIQVQLQPGNIFSYHIRKGLVVSNYLNNHLYSTCKLITLIAMSVKIGQLHFSPNVLMYFCG